MSEQQLCPQCGGQIPEGAPAGLCPKCLMLAGLESRPPVDPSTAATQPPPSSASTGFVPPTVEEIAAKFPQLEVLELLGRGGMGAVYKARQRELDRLVAVKILPPEVSRDPTFAERFTREARALARLNHPNIVGVYDFGRTPNLPSPSGRGAGGEGKVDAASPANRPHPNPLPEGEGTLFYFIMEYVDGVNLRQAIQAGGMDPKQALAIVPQICDALQFAHDEGIMHRDIKPENVLIDKRGRVKIADFGLAKLLGQESVDHGLTATQQVMGTLRYMAPEQMEGTKTVDHRADIYSLGVVFYELLTGELPIGRFAPPSKMVEIDVRLDEVVLRALEKKPEQRYQHASEVRTDIDNIASGSGASARRATAAVESALPAWWLRQSRATQWSIRGLLIALFVIGAAGFLYNHQYAGQTSSGGKITSFTLGAWQPWYSYEWEDGKGGSSYLNLYSLSSLFGVMALCSLVVFVKTAVTDRRRREPAASVTGPDRSFVAAVATALVAAWIALLISTNGDKLPFGIRPTPPVIIGIHLLFPLLVAALAAGVFAYIWPRPSEPFLERLARPAPMLLGCHLLMFSIALFTCGYDSLEWDSVNFTSPNVGIADLHPHEQIAYQVRPFDSWVGKLAAGTAGVGLFALLLTLGTPPRLRARAAVLVLVGLITLGAVAEYMALRPPKTITFTREQYRAFDPDYANGSTYEQFVRDAEAEFEAFVTYPPPGDARARAEHASFKIELSKVVVHHYFRDEVAWFLLPGGLILLCGLLTWRQAAAVEEPAAGPQLAPLAAIATFVGIAGPLVCVPGLIVAFLMLDQKEYLWGSAPSMSFIIGLVGMLVFMGISLLAMSVLGAAAIGQIRRSGGKFFGLRLALLEALFCPAIALCWVAFFVLALVLSAQPRPKNAGMAISPVLFAVFVFVVVTIALIYWRLVRKLKQSPREPGEKLVDKPAAAAAPPDASSQFAAIGRISLWTSIIGVVAPIILGLIGNLVNPARRLSDESIMLYCAFWIVLEIVAFGCGIASRRTASGKVGLVVSVISFLLAGLVLAWTTLPSETRRSASAPSQTAKNSDQTPGATRPLEQSGKFTFIANPPNGPTDQEGVIYFPIPYASPPNIELGGDAGEVVIVDCTSKSFKWRNAGFLGQFHVSWTARGARGKPDGSDSPSEIAANSPVTPTGVARAANPFGLHPGKQVPPTPAELSHILGELPKEFTKGLLGSNERSIKDLDTKVFAIDYDDGPADFWLQVKETGQQTFPVRLPSRNETESWRIPKAKAHILMWIQPRQSVGMSDRLRGALAGLPPGCSLGIDVDGKAVARINYDTPVGGVNQAIPNPLWSGWASEEMQPGEGGFDSEMASQALLYIGRKSMAEASTASCQLGLMYRPDREKKPSGSPPPAAPPAMSSGLHPGKLVPPTPKELAHILAELPKEFTKGLQGSDEQRIMDLDTRVFAIEFDDGPADFWVQAKETEQQTFPDRLPTLNTGRTRRIPASKAHILMWIQPRHSESMSAKLQTALYGMRPGFSLGIDVDGKPEMRVNHDVPFSQVTELIPQPFWSVGGASDMRAGADGFDAEMASQAILYIGRKTTINGGVAATCQLGLMYRPDRQTKGSDR